MTASLKGRYLWPAVKPMRRILTPGLRGGHHATGEFDRVKVSVTRITI